MKRLMIIGAGGHGKVVADAALLAGWQDIRFADARFPEQTRLRQWPIVGTDRQVLQQPPDVDGVVIAIGNNRARLAVQQRFAAAGWPLVSIIHPSAVVSPFAHIGAGSMVLAGAIINIDAHIGEGSIINSGAVVEHDCHLGQAVHVSPQAALAGNVTVGDCSWIGIGSSVRQGVHIGAGVIVGAGAAVVGDVGDGLTVVGVPARPLHAGSLYYANPAGSA